MAHAEDHIRELLKLPPDNRARAARLLLDSLDERRPSRDELGAVWSEWLARGPQGPIEDDEDEDGAASERP